MSKVMDKIKKCDNDGYSTEARRFLIILALGVAAMILAESALIRFEFPQWLEIAIALAHVPFTIWIALSGWKVLMAMDELQRHIHLQSFMFGITAASVYMLTGNLLNEAGIGNGVITFMFWPMLWIFYSIRYAWLKKSYKE